MSRILCIRLPNWPIQHLRRARPELNDRAVVLHESRRGVERVVACCARAAAMGISSGMPIAEVKSRPAVAGTATSHLTLESYDPIADREVIEALANRCSRFSPIVGLDSATPPEGLLLDITGVARLFGGEAAMAEQIIAEFTRRRLIVSIGVADAVGAAWAIQFSIFNFQFAIYNRSSPCRRRPGAPPAIIPPGGTPTALRPLPIESLRLPAETVDLLHQLGIERIGQLEALPREELSSRFGPELLRRMDQAAGRLSEPVVACEPPPEFQADLTLEHPTQRRETVEAVIERLIRRVAKELLQCGRGAVRLECRLRCHGGEQTCLAVGLFEPTASAEHLVGLVQLQLDGLRLPSAVTAVQAAATASAPLDRKQQALFGDDSPRRNPRRLAALVDRLSSRLGRRAVLGVRLSRDAQPELAWQYHPLVDARRRGGRRRTLSAGLPPRPLRLLRRPAAIGVTSILPDGPPLRFELHGREHRIAQTWGGERIETGWWRGRTVGRDYYRVETQTGRRYWLFRRLRDGRWFLHGMF